MRRMCKGLWATLLALMICMAGATAWAEQGNLTGNLNNGGFVAQDESGVYLADDGLWRADERGKVQRLDDGEISRISLWEDFVYYLKTWTEEGTVHGYRWNADPQSGDETEFGYEESVGEVQMVAPYRVKKDGSGTAEQLGQARARSDGDSAYDGFTVVDGKIYYVAGNDQPGQYTVMNQGQEVTVNYRFGNSIYRMDLDGQNVTELVGGLGNDYPRMAIDGQTVYALTSYAPCFNEGSIVGFLAANLDGTNVRPVVGSDRDYNWGQVSDLGNLSLEDCLQAADGYLYIEQLNGGTGITDRLISRYSEDGTQHSQVAVILRGSAVLRDGKLYAICAPNDEWSEDGITPKAGVAVGIYEMDLANPAQRRAVWTDHWFLADGYVYDADLSINGDYAYVRKNQYDYSEEAGTQKQREIRRIGLSDGKVETLKDGVWSEAVDSEYYIADSDTRLLTRDELQNYSKEELGFIRNEILARHGYPFKTEKYKEHFEATSWYVRDEGFSYDRLSQLEQQNVALIQELEKE